MFDGEGWPSFTSLTHAEEFVREEGELSEDECADRPSSEACVYEAADTDP